MQLRSVDWNTPLFSKRFSVKCIKRRLFQCVAFGIVSSSNGKANHQVGCSAYKILELFGSPNGSASLFVNDLQIPFAKPTVMRDKRIEYLRITDRIVSIFNRKLLLERAGSRRNGTDYVTGLQQCVRCGTFYQLR